jgi:hypothetical protein
MTRILIEFPVFMSVAGKIISTLASLVSVACWYAALRPCVTYSLTHVSN